MSTNTNKSKNELGYTITADEMVSINDSTPAVVTILDGNDIKTMPLLDVLKKMSAILKEDLTTD